MLGAHMSIAGGYYKAVLEAADCGCDCVQLFTKNNNQWKGKPILDSDVGLFRETLAEKNIGCPLSHASYLINLAAPEDELWKKSIDAMTIELQRADQLGIDGVVLHPGSYTTSSEEEGIDRIIQAIDQIHKAYEGTSKILLENTAGQGSNLGWRFEQLGKMISGVKNPDRLGVCFDTCHAFAAGYELAEPEQYLATMRIADEAFGLPRIKAFHLNDSKGKLGSRKDRHEHIGEGELGIEPFRNLLNDSRFFQVPKYLETPKEERDGEKCDVINLRKLRSLIVNPSPTKLQ